MSLEDGIKALQQKRYSDAVQSLEIYCRTPENRYSPCYIQAQMALARAYRGDNQRDKALALGQALSNHCDTEVREWAQGFVSIIVVEEKVTGLATGGGTAKIHEKAPRGNESGVCLQPAKIGDNLSLAATVTFSLMFGIILVLCLGLVWIVNHDHPLLDLMIASGITLVINLLSFLFSPWIMDLSQQWLYKTRWVTLAEIKRSSPESATIIQRVCREKRINPPRLGIIDDQNPTAFTYGSLRGNARLVVSQGLFTYLEDDEIATVYAHELGHIVHGDFALMTMATTFIQVLYLLYLFCRNFGRKHSNNNKLQAAAETAAIAAYIFYLIGNYLILYLSRTREYLADHFAAETTGNPNGLSRALVKIAYGILEEERQNQQPSQLIESTRALGIYDHKVAVSAGTAYQIALDVRKLGKVFLWDLFNPWGQLMELSSTHPLTGKRIGILSNYAEQIGLDTEFGMSTVIREGNNLNKSKLYRGFIVDLLIFNAQWLGGFSGLIIGLCLSQQIGTGIGIFSFLVSGFGIGMMLKAYVIYPSFKKALRCDVFSLICDPYASPLRGNPVHLKGKLIGRGEREYQFNSDLMVQDQTGMMVARYVSRLGSVGNFLFGWRKVAGFIDTDVSLVGWFRRGISPWVDWQNMTCKIGQLHSYPRFWSLMVGSSLLIIGFVMLIFALGNRVPA